MSCEVPDRLNLGCGLDYRAGYLNLDRSPAAVADAIVSAHTLELPGAHFREILLNNLIEHLGYCGAYRLLIALHPTLRDDGELRIATPDLDCAIAQYAQTASPAGRENLLCHLYGTEETGMSHLFCFPRDCLVELLEHCGYRISALDATEPAPQRPQLEVVAVRNSAPDVVARNELTAQIFATPTLHIGYADFPYFEGLIDLAWQAATPAAFDEFVHLGRVTSARLTLLLVRGLRDRLTGLIGGAAWSAAEGLLVRLANRDPFALLAPAVDAGQLRNFAAARQHIDQKQTSSALESLPTGETGDFASDFFTPERFAEFMRRSRALAIRAGDEQRRAVLLAVEPG